MWIPARSQWIVIWSAALVTVVLLGEPTEWRFAFTTPERLAATTPDRLTPLNAPALTTGPTPSLSDREIARGQRRRSWQRVARITRARRHLGLSIAGLAFLVVWWLEGRRRTTQPG
jgi:hypothetical protein